MTAAPRMTRPSWLLPAFRSDSTRAEMPTEVAQRQAPMKSATGRDTPPGISRKAAPSPRSTGMMTPATATLSAGRPTFSICGTVLSSPTLNISSTTPTAAKRSAEGSPAASENHYQARWQAAMAMPILVVPMRAGAVEAGEAGLSVLYPALAASQMAASSTSAPRAGSAWAVARSMVGFPFKRERGLECGPLVRPRP